VSPRSYNRKSGLGLFCPVTSRVKGYPFEVPIPEGLPVAGVVLADQVKSLDWRARRAELAARLPDESLAEVMGKLTALLEP
jgi:mRNA interferase MazF